jgi:hypothetical protein
MAWRIPNWVPFIARKIARRRLQVPVKQYKLNPPDSFVRQPRFEQAFKSAVLDGVCGARVLRAPPGSGKSAYSRKLLEEMRLDGTITGALFVSSYQELLSGHYLDPFTWLKNILGVPHSGMDVAELCAHGNKPCVFIFDQFEALAGSKPEVARQLLKTLAEEAQLNKTMQILVTVRSDALAAEVLAWNGNEKIVEFPPRAIVWNDTELKELHSKLDWKLWSDDNRERVLDLAIEKAPLPGFLVTTSSNYELYRDDPDKIKKKAEYIANEMERAGIVKQRELLSTDEDK